MLPVTSRHNPDWLAQTLEGVRSQGVAVVEEVLSAEELAETRAAMLRARQGILAAVGAQRLERAGEIGVLRLMLAHDDHFFRLLEIPELLAIVDAALSNTAILHLQNGLILPPVPKEKVKGAFQGRFHRDFPRHLNGYLASINVFIAVDEFRADNGGTLVVPGSQQRGETPALEELERQAIPVVCRAGSLIVFDSTTWHAAGVNTTAHDRLAINHQFTRSFIKQQIDYVRALGDAKILAQPERTQQLLGWYTRVVTSLDEYYRAPGERLYRAGQG
jgi:ectoine hydroxylase-related dioxygenase (phytanoyl-CoA dioxygenase family)